MGEQIALFDAPPRVPNSSKILDERPQLPGDTIQVRTTRRAHVCVVCQKEVAKGQRAEVWPEGASHIECGLQERWSRRGA